MVVFFAAAAELVFNVFFFLSRFTTSLILLLGFRSADGDDTVVVFHSIVFLFL